MTSRGPLCGTSHYNSDNNVVHPYGLHAKLNEIKFSIKPWPTSLTERHHDFIINRLRIGHTFLTFGYLMRRGGLDQCSTFSEAL